ncbi:MAG: hypothetical protein WD512_15815 [Candidatus Paceibacterota bacterium]
MDNLSPEQIQAMIAMLQHMLPNKNNEETENFSVKKTKRKNSSSNTQSKSTGGREQHYNKFVDMPEKNMHKEDIIVDKKLIVQAPVPRGRPFKPVNVVCRVCGKKEKVSPGLVPESFDRYKCNKCSAVSG